MFDVSLLAAVVSLIAAYCVGLIPAAHWIGKAHGVDPTAEGSKNPGASNMYRLAGKTAGAAVLALDAAKGLVPVLLAFALGSRPLGVAVGFAAMLGHIFPATRKFHGGKGVATAAGVTLAAWPLLAVIFTLVFAVSVRLFNVAAIGSLVIAIGLPLGVYLTHHDNSEVLWAVAMAVVVIGRHASNIGRLVRHEENIVRNPGAVPPVGE